MMERITPRHHRWFGAVLVLFLLAEAALAVPPQQTNTDAGRFLLITYPPDEYHQLGVASYENLLVLNTSFAVLNASANEVTCWYGVEKSDGSITQDINVTEYLDPYVRISLVTDENGEYAYCVWCNTSTEHGYLCADYVVSATGRTEPVEGRFLAGIIALIPLFFAFLMAVWAFNLEEEHRLLKHFLFLFGFVLTWVSLHYATLGVIKFYEWPELQETVGDTLYWLVVVFVVIFFYFIIYYIAWMINSAANKKKERLNY